MIKRIAPEQWDDDFFAEYMGGEKTKHLFDEIDRLTDLLRSARAKDPPPGLTGVS